MLTFRNLNTQHFLYFHKKSYISVYYNLLFSNTYIQKCLLHVYLSKLWIVFSFLATQIFTTCSKNSYLQKNVGHGDLMIRSMGTMKHSSIFQDRKIIIHDIQRQSFSWGKLWRGWGSKWIKFSLRIPDFMCIRKQSLYETKMEEDFFLQPTCWSCLKIRSEHHLRRFQIVIDFLAVIVSMIKV